MCGGGGGGGDEIWDQMNLGTNEMRDQGNRRGV